MIHACKALVHNEGFYFSDNSEFLNVRNNNAKLYLQNIYIFLFFIAIIIQISYMVSTI